MYSQTIEQHQQCHTARSKEKVLAEMQEQLNTVLLHTAPSRLDKRNTDTGIKDKFFLHFFEQLKAACATAKASKLGSAQAVRAVIAKRCADMPDDIFNPAFSIPGQ